MKYIDEFLFNLPYELEYTPPTILAEKALIIRDKKDVPVLYSAIISDVDIFITGDNVFDNDEENDSFFSCIHKKV